MWFKYILLPGASQKVSSGHKLLWARLFFFYPRLTSNRRVDGLPKFCNSLLTSDSRSELLFPNWCMMVLVVHTSVMRAWRRKCCFQNGVIVTSVKQLRTSVRVASRQKRDAKRRLLTYWLRFHSIRKLKKTIREQILYWCFETCRRNRCRNFWHIQLN
jgi:hypothetical protein